MTTVRIIDRILINGVPHFHYIDPAYPYRIGLARVGCIPQSVGS